MQYMLLIYHSDPRGAVGDATIAEFMTEIGAYNDGLKRSGHFIVSGGLAFPDTATCVRQRNGKVSMTDGPFAETKEFLGGFYLIEARDLNDALKVAEGLPMTRFGTVEVRPLNKLDAMK